MCRHTWMTSYLNTSTALSSNDTSFIPVAITSDPLSMGMYRFRLVFKPGSTLPVILSEVKAYQKDDGVQVEWKTESESGMDRYEVEKATNAQHFETAGTVTAKNNALSNNYVWFDENATNGIQYYRIKYISKSGEVKYSEVVKVNVTRKAAGTTIYASATTKSEFTIQINNAEKGKYGVALVNGLGQKMFTGEINHPGGSATSTIRLPGVIPGGIYHVQVLAGGRVFTSSVLIP